MTDPTLASLPSVLGPSMTPVEARARVVEYAVRDLLGPAGGAEEEIDARDFPSVRERYVLGCLAPLNQALDEGGADPGEAEQTQPPSSEDGRTEDARVAARGYFPSSLGLSSSVEGDVTAVVVEVDWGRYEKLHQKAEDGTTLSRWKRVPFSAASKPIRLTEGPLRVWAPDPERPEIIVRGIARMVRGDWVVSLFLVNGQTAAERNKDARWLFQAKLTVRAVDGTPIFIRRGFDPDRDRLDPVQLTETRRLEMVYRHIGEFATGRGVSIRATPVPDDPTRATRVETSWVPAFEVPRTDPGLIPGLSLDMMEIARATDAAAVVRLLTPLTTDYRRWIGEREAAIGTDASLASFGDEARVAMAECRRALARIEEGIALLERHPDALAAFQFANRAMALQRIRSAYAEARRKAKGEAEAAVRVEDHDVPGNRTWRPFQIAFLLLNLPSTTDFHHPDRSHETDAVADLLWFPTGGGKTEAYLGLAAYVMGLRRLQGTVAGHDGDSGVAVLMRYTLRLLTLQQFQRAAALVCACEVIRRESLAQGENGGRGRWGHEPFRIGLWVGLKTTPNKISGAAEAISQARSSVNRKPSLASGSPHQLTSCPWCGSPLDLARDYKAEAFERGRLRLIVSCSDPTGSCDFTLRKAPGEGIPALVVDEEIYRRPPSLLIATVDKFAQLAWNGQTQTLFGRVTKHCSRHGYWNPSITDTNSHPDQGPDLPKAVSREVPHLRPPDLIIQDELHLISGPLGTLVGLYETAVDELCSWTVDGRRVRPKVIAATATVRQAPQQVRNLFLRRVEVFPPQGLDARDTFFAVQVPPDQSPGRLYLGLCAPGRRLKKLLIRVYTAFLSAAQTVYERDGLGAEADPWMSLIGYFNSMRELGGMRRLIDDDVRQGLRDMDKRGLSNRRAPILEELTSRKRATEIPDLLDRLALDFDPAVAARRKAGDRTRPPLDVLLATNMVSVGVDVPRLGLMVVAGQPKTTAEYIQASSRVGRRFPGLVCTVYNWGRPRDLSHYETFNHYHATFYRHVEGLSVTPFASRAVDRGLSGVLISLARNLGLDLNAENSARRIDRANPILRAAVDAIVRRERALDGDGGRVEDIEAEIERRIAVWIAEANVPTRGLVYHRADGQSVALLKKPGAEAWTEFTCLNSLREVEPSTPLILTTAPLFDDDAVVTGDTA